VLGRAEDLPQTPTPGDDLVEKGVGATMHGRF
jgi:hypothetical protein